MLDKEKFAPHVEDITRALGNKVSKEEIERELENYVNLYRVDIGIAKRSIVKKYGGRLIDLSLGVFKKLSELKPNEPSVDLLCRIVSVNQKDVEVNGNPKSILYGILGDQTSTTPFTAWETEGLDLKKGDIVKIRNAYTKEWQGNVQVNFGVRTSISKELETALPPYEGIVKVTKYKITDLKGGIGNVATVARILSIEKREVTVDGQPKTVFSGILGDETGKAQFSAWSDFNLKEGDVIEIIGGYVRHWRGIPQLNFDERAKVEKLEIAPFPSAQEISKGKVSLIEEIAACGGAVDALIHGIVIDVKKGSGLIFRCPECKRVLQKESCRIHGKVSGIPDLRVKATVDDGTGALTAVLNKELTESLLKKSIKECLASAKEAMNTEVISDELTEMLIARPIQAKGNVTSDEFGLMMIASSVALMKTDVQNAAKQILEELEG